jgi:hypothetical protein
MLSTPGNGAGVRAWNYTNAFSSFVYSGKPNLNQSNEKRDDSQEGDKV